MELSILRYLSENKSENKILIDNPDFDCDYIAQPFLEWILMM